MDNSIPICDFVTNAFVTLLQIDLRLSDKCIYIALEYAINYNNHGVSEKADRGQGHVHNCVDYLVEMIYTEL